MGDPVLSPTTSGSVWRRFERAAEAPSCLHIAGDGTRPLADLVESASKAAAGLVARGIGPGSRVGALMTTTFELVEAVLATWAAGATFVSLPSRPVVGSAAGWRLELDARIGKADVELLLLDEGERGLDVAPPTCSIAQLSTAGSTVVADDIDARSPALIQFSSGTTANPRGVLLTHAALGAQFDAVTSRAGPAAPGDRHLLSWLPLHHDLGFVAYLLLPLARGDNLTLIPTPSFLRDPLTWLRTISESRATQSPAPNFAYGLVARHLERTPVRRLDLSSWRYASTGGEAIDAATLDRFARAAAPFGFDPSAFVPGYGLAEATCIVSVRAPSTGVLRDEVDRQALMQGVAEPVTSGPSSVTFVSTGEPLDGCSVRMVRDGGPAGEREIGEILVKAPFVMDGYVEDEPGTREVLQDGWLRTGDLGYLADGQLYVTGRSKDLVIVRGQNLHPEDLERLAIDTPGIRPGGVVAVGDRQGGADEHLLIVAETILTARRERDRCREELVRRIWRATGLSPRVILAPSGSVAKTTSGKLRRSETLARALDGRIVDVDDPR